MSPRKFKEPDSEAAWPKSQLCTAQPLLREAWDFVCVYSHELLAPLNPFLYIHTNTFTWWLLQLPEKKYSSILSRSLKPWCHATEARRSFISLPLIKTWIILFSRLVEELFLKPSKTIFLLTYHFKTSVGQRWPITRKQASPMLSSLLFQLHDHRRREKNDDELKILLSVILWSINGT